MIAPVKIPLPRVLLQQNSVAHYRRALYEALRDQGDAEYDFIADQRPDTPFVETLESTWTARLGLRQARTLTLSIRGTYLYLQPQAIVECLFGRYDAVVALGSPYSITAWGLLATAKLRRIPVLLWTHGLLEPESGLKWLVRSLLYRQADGLLLYGERAVHLLQSKGVPAEKLHVIYNSLDTSLQERALQASLELSVMDARRAMGICDAERVLIFTGRLQPVKRLDLVVRMLASLKDDGLNVHALFVGEGREEAHLKTLARDLDVEDRLHLVGASHDEYFIARAFRASDLCVIPSGAGLSVMHALAYGTPVVTHNDPGRQFPEAEAIIHGKTGFLFQAGDERSFLGTLQHALFPQNSKDTLFQTCRDMVLQRYSPAQHAKKMTDAVLTTLRTSPS